MKIAAIKNPKQRAFTLAEMAIVVVLAGILLTMGLKMTQSNMTNSAYALTASNQALIKQALINYLRTNGRLPCPDTTALPLAPTGSQVSPCSGSVAAGSGVVPWIDLQLSRDIAMDGWGNFFSYRVANGFVPIAKNWTIRTVAGPTFDMGQLGKAVPDVALTIQQGDGVNPLTTITNNAVVAIVSYGKNGLGAKTLLGQLNTLPPVGTNERTNATVGSTTLVIRPVSDVGVAATGAFDDRVIYLLPQDLLQPLVSEGTVAVCKAYCPPCTGPGVASGVNQPYCTGANLPATSATAVSCTGAGTPYAKCASANTPLCTVTVATPIPIGNPTPACP